MKFTKTKLAFVALAFYASSASAASIGYDTIIVNIVKDTNDVNTDRASMLIDTNISSVAVGTGALTSWTSSQALTDAIASFLGDATGASFWAAGVWGVDFTEAALSAQSLPITSSAAINGMRTNYRSYIDTAENGVFAPVVDTGDANWAIDIADGDASHYTNRELSQYVSGISQGADGIFFSNESDLFDGLKNVELRSVWKLDANNVLSYDAPSAVPVPAAVWLFGSGLIGLVGVARRRKA